MHREASVEAPVKRETEGTSRLDALAVLKEVLEVERESKPNLNVDGMISYALANPESEIVDSLGAVSVVCVLYGAYTADKLIPQHLLTHHNFTTLQGLRKVLNELDKRQAK